MGNYRETISELFKQTSFPHHPATCVHDLLGNKKIILYGGGDGFITFSVFVLRKYGLKASAVLDRKFKSGDTHFRLPAFSPLEYTPPNEEKENAVAIFTVGKWAYQQEKFTFCWFTGKCCSANNRFFKTYISRSI